MGFLFGTSSGSARQRAVQHRQAARRKAKAAQRKQTMGGSIEYSFGGKTWPWKK